MSGVVLVGIADLDAGFFASRNEHRAFLKFAYKFLGLQEETANDARTDYKTLPFPSEKTRLHFAAASNDEAAQTANDGNLSQPQQQQQRGPYKIKVTFAIRLANRRVLNLPQLLRAIELQSDVVDMRWLEEHIFPLESIPFRDQVAIVAQTDILVGSHGSLFANCVFLRPHSVALALVPSRHIEFALPQLAAQAEVQFLFVPLLDASRQRNCMQRQNHSSRLRFLHEDECLRRTLRGAGELDCMHIRLPYHTYRSYSNCNILYQTLHTIWKSLVLIFNLT